MFHATSAPAGGVAPRVQRARPLPTIAPLALPRPASWSRRALARRIQLTAPIPPKGVA